MRSGRLTRPGEVVKQQQQVAGGLNWQRGDTNLWMFGWHVQYHVSEQEDIMARLAWSNDSEKGDRWPKLVQRGDALWGLELPMEEMEPL